MVTLSSAFLLPQVSALRPRSSQSMRSVRALPQARHSTPHPRIMDDADEDDEDDEDDDDSSDERDEAGSFPLWFQMSVGGRVAVR